MQQGLSNELEPDWKATKLSLERPYKDDDDNLIQTLLDITADGQFIYEPLLDRETKLGERFRRIFLERGHDFFEKDDGTRYGHEQAPEEKPDDVSGAQQDVETPPEVDGEQKYMTPETLLKMRWDLLPRLQCVCVCLLGQSQ